MPRKSPAIDRIASGVLACDLGKTSCRVQLGDAAAAAAGAPGLADHDGVARASEAIAAAASALPNLSDAGAISVGAAGALSAPDASRALAARLARDFAIPAVVTSDVITAHVGAFAGDTGTLLIAGTGAVAVGISDDGDMLRVDGAGPWLGDDGSGQWIGRSGLRAALAAVDGRGPQTSLVAMATARYGRLDALPGQIGSATSPAREVARFAPDVLTAALGVDRVALQIVDDAVDALARTALATDVLPIAIAGGLTSSRPFLRRLEESIRAAGGQVVPVRGTAISGAILIATDPALPHERFVHRAS